MILFCFRASLQKLMKSVNRLYSSNTSEIMSKHGVVPDVIPVAPNEFATIKFPSGISVDRGNVLTPTQVKDPPHVGFNADSKSFYLLCLTDPDSPSRKRPTYREWHHWLVGNIPGDNISSGEILSDYISPCPPRTSGLHRYVFLIYKQSGKLNFDEPRLTNARSNGRELFKIKKLADKYKLNNPIAGNFFQAEWDEFVEEIYIKLSKL